MFARHTEVSDIPQPSGSAFVPAGHTAEGCATVREVLGRVGDKWSVLVIGMLGAGTHRFSELQRTIEGISQRMLTLTLRQLERDGLVWRTVYPEVPPRVEYTLTDLGCTLLQTVRSLGMWAEEHRSDIQAARVRFDVLAEEH